MQCSGWQTQVNNEVSQDFFNIDILIYCKRIIIKDIKIGQ